MKGRLQVERQGSFQGALRGKADKQTPQQRMRVCDGIKGHPCKEHCSNGGTNKAGIPGPCACVTVWANAHTIPRTVTVGKARPGQMLPAVRPD